MREKKFFVGESRVVWRFGESGSDRRNTASVKDLLEAAAQYLPDSPEKRKAIAECQRDTRGQCSSLATMVSQNSAVKKMGYTAPAQYETMEFPVGLKHTLASAASGQIGKAGGWKGYKKAAGHVGRPPEGMGVCTDVLDRALLYLKFDLRKAMIKLGMSSRNANLAFRRVQQIIPFFDKSKDFTKLFTLTPQGVYGQLRSLKSGDIITFNQPGTRADHVAIIDSNANGSITVTHNMGTGVKKDVYPYDYFIAQYGHIAGFYRFNGGKNI